ncbi:hypothetical protein D3C80_2175380 [compost metagenome]
MSPAFPAVTPADKGNISVAEGKQVAECLVHRLPEMRPHRIIVRAFPVLVNQHYSVGISMQPQSLIHI